MSTVETIIVGGGIQPGNPFALNYFPYVSNVTPPQVVTSTLLQQVTGANPAIVVATVDPQPAAIEVLRVKGGMITEGAGSDSVVIGRGASATFNDSIAIGRGAQGGQQGVAIGRLATLNVTGSGVCIGASSSIANTLSLGGVVVGANSTAGGPTGGNIIVGNANTVPSENNIVIAMGCSLPVGAQRNVVVGPISTFGGTARDGCVLLNGDNPTGDREFRVGGSSSFREINLMVIGCESDATAVKVSCVWRTTNGNGNDNMGRPLTIQPGMSTGLGAGADVILATGAAVGAGAVLQVSTPRVVVRGGTGLVEVLAPTSGVSMLVHGLPNQAAIQINADAGAPGAMFDFNTTNTAGGGAAGTLNNAPSAGDPAAWIPVLIGGVAYKIPAWLV
jgi:hypothetical protein